MSECVWGGAGCVDGATVSTCRRWETCVGGGEGGRRGGEGKGGAGGANPSRPHFSRTPMISTLTFYCRRWARLRGALTKKQLCALQNHLFSPSRDVRSDFDIKSTLAFDYCWCSLGGIRAGRVPTELVPFSVCAMVGRGVLPQIGTTSQIK